MMKGKLRMREVILTPNYEVTTEFLAGIFVEQASTDKSATSIVSLIEQIRYLMQTDPDSIERIINRLKRRYGYVSD